MTTTVGNVINSNSLEVGGDVTSNLSVQNAGTMTVDGKMSADQYVRNTADSNLTVSNGLETPTFTNLGTATVENGFNGTTLNNSGTASLTNGDLIVTNISNDKALNITGADIGLGGNITGSARTEDSVLNIKNSTLSLTATDPKTVVISNQNLIADNSDLDLRGTGNTLFNNTAFIAKNNASINVKDDEYVDYEFAELNTTSSNSFEIDIKCDSDNEITADTIHITNVNGNSGGTIYLTAISLQEIIAVSTTLDKNERHTYRIVYNNSASDAEHSVQINWIDADGNEAIRLQQPAADMTTSTQLPHSYGIASSQRNGIYDSVQIRGELDDFVEWANYILLPEEAAAGKSKNFEFLDDWTLSKDVLTLKENTTFNIKGNGHTFDIDNHTFLEEVEAAQDVTISDLKIVNNEASQTTVSGKLTLDNVSMKTDIQNDNVLALKGTDDLANITNNNTMTFDGEKLTLNNLTNTAGADAKLNGNVSAKDIVNTADSQFDVKGDVTATTIKNSGVTNINGATNAKKLNNKGSFNTKGDTYIVKITNSNGVINSSNGKLEVSTIKGENTGHLNLDHVAFTPKKLVENQIITAINGSVIDVSKNPYMIKDNEVMLTDTIFNLGNIDLSPLEFGKLQLTGKSVMNIDSSVVDYATETMGKVVSNGDFYLSPESVVNLKGINLLNLTDRPLKNGMTSVNFIQDTFGANVNYTGPNMAMAPIWKYGIDYDKYTGDLVFAQGGHFNAETRKIVYPKNPSDSFNPAVLASPVAAQLGGYFSMLDTYTNAFNNLDMQMLKPYNVRMAEMNANKYALVDGTNVNYNPNQMNSKGVWYRPFANYDSVRLHNGPKVHNFTYGSFLGGDSEMIKLKNGFYGVVSPFVSYTGSHQSYDGNSIYQNGGNLGITGSFYKGNFFTGVTIGTGASLAEASTMYGHEDFSMLMAGAAAKSGYNFEFKEGKFILQPSMQVSYTFVNTFDYTNAAGVRLNADPMHAIQLSPNFKFIMNTKNGWSPYATFGINWNLMDKTNFTAYIYDLPNMSVRPYFQYGIGLQKTTKGRFTGFGQMVFRNGGRTGFGITFGFRWALGKDNSAKNRNEKVQAPSNKKVIKSLSQPKEKLATM